MDLSLLSPNIGRSSILPLINTAAVLAPDNITAPPNFGPAYAVNLSARGRDAARNGESENENNIDELGKTSDTKKADGTECQTCKSRKYQDGSNDANVSFKAPGHIAPENSAAVVASHEQEHVNNAQAEDKKANKELVSSSVRLYSSICPECGRSYTAGGETTTVMKTTKENKASSEDKLGKNIDIAA